ncbi:MAG: hypothetical protein WA947_19820 [Phormidesmis sp.]
MVLLSSEDVEIISVQHPKSAKRVPVLCYANKNFRLVSVFGIEQEEEAHAKWRQLTDNQSKVCVLLEETFRYSVWSQVRIDQGLLAPTAPEAYVRACVVLVQSLHHQAQKLGSRQAQSLMMGLQTNAAYPVQTAGGLDALLQLNLSQMENGSSALPRWEEDDLSSLLLQMHRLGCKFFGRSRFTGPAIASLDALSNNDKALFLAWLKLSLLGNLWLS